MLAGTAVIAVIDLTHCVCQRYPQPAQLITALAKNRIGDAVDDLEATSLAILADKEMR
jgi:hypothetical protein